jgi:hypothetical protein
VLLRGDFGRDVVIASWGDNITPPQQALYWIPDLYQSVAEIIANEQTIIYTLDERIGHLGIFVLAATDSPAAPWYVVPADDKRRARLNLISHMLSKILYQKVRVDLPKIPKAAPRPKGVEQGLRAGQIVPNLY